MKKEILTEVLKEVSSSMSMAMTHFELSENISFRIDDITTNDYNNLEKAKIIGYEFNSNFYGKFYRFIIEQKDIERDFRSITCEGDSELFDSFIQQVQDEYWELIVLICNRYWELEKEYIKDCA